MFQNSINKSLTPVKSRWKTLARIWCESSLRCDAMRCDAMRCDAMRCDAMRRAMWLSYYFLTILWEIVTSAWELYMLNVKYWRIFIDVISLLAQVVIVSFDRAYKEVSTNKYWFFFLYFSLWYDNVTSLWHWPLTIWRSILFGELLRPY